MELLTIGKGSRIRKVLSYAAILLLYCVALGVFYHFMQGDLFPYDSLKAGVISYLINLIPTAILTIVNVFIIFHLLEKTIFARYLSLKIAADFFISLAAMYFFIWLFVTINRPFDPDIDPDPNGVLLHNVLIMMSLEILYYVRWSQRALKEAEYAKREALQYQYDALKAQVNPHFLFNSLNILLSLISIDTRKAGDFTMALSHIYRYVLSIQNKTSVLLADELEFFHSYVSILEMRYNRSFRVDICLEAAADDRHIVPFTLQLLIENVTKHNVISSKHPMKVSIHVCGDHVSVSNPIHAKKGEINPTSGIGLKYLAEQYRIGGKEFRFTNDGQYFTAQIPYL